MIEISRLCVVKIVVFSKTHQKTFPLTAESFSWLHFLSGWVTFMHIDGSTKLSTTFVPLISHYYKGSRWVVGRYHVDQVTYRPMAPPAAWKPWFLPEEDSVVPEAESLEPASGTTAAVLQLLCWGLGADTGALLLGGPAGLLGLAQGVADEQALMSEGRPALPPRGGAGGGLGTQGLPQRLWTAPPAACSSGWSLGPPAPRS